MSSAYPTFADLGQALREYRARHVLTQAELARKLRIPLRSLQDYEAGAMPRQARRRKILAFLAADLQEAAA